MIGAAILALGLQPPAISREADAPTAVPAGSEPAPKDSTEPAAAAPVPKASTDRLDGLEKRLGPWLRHRVLTYRPEHKHEGSAEGYPAE